MASDELIERLSAASAYFSMDVSDEAEEHGCAIDDAISRLASTPQPSGEGWRDIASAPKDGTPFLAMRAGSDVGSIIVARAKPQWTGFYSVPGDYSCKGPTHWMPIPAAPGSSQPSDMIGRDEAAAERERCAKIASSTGEQWSKWGDADGVTMGAESFDRHDCDHAARVAFGISAAIRLSTATEGERS